MFEYDDAHEALGAGNLLFLLQMLEQDPKESSSVIARMAGSCLVCGRPMTTEKSLKNGIGDVCMEKLGIEEFSKDDVYLIDTKNKVIGNLMNKLDRSE